MKTGIDIKHSRGVSIYSDSQSLMDSLSEATPLPLNEEQEEAFGEFYTLQVNKLREENTVVTPIAPLPSDIISMRGNLNRVVPAGFIMLYNKLDEIQKEGSLSNGGGFLGGGGGGGSGEPGGSGSPSTSAVSAEELQVSLQQAAESARQAQESARQAQQAADVARDSQFQGVSIPLDPFRVTAVQQQQTKPLELPQVSLTTGVGAASRLELNQVILALDTLENELRTQNSSTLQQTQNLVTQVEGLRSTGVGIQSQIEALKVVDANTQAQLNNQRSLSSSFQTQLNVLSAFDSTVQQQLQSLVTSNSNVQQQISGLEAYDLSVQKQLQDLSAFDTRIQQQVTGLGAFDTKIQQQVTGLGAFDTWVQGQVLALNSFDTWAEGQIENLGSGLNVQQEVSSLSSQVQSLSSGMGSLEMSLNARIAQLSSQVSTLSSQALPPVLTEGMKLEVMNILTESLKSPGLTEVIQKEISSALEPLLTPEEKPTETSSTFSLESLLEGGTDVDTILAILDAIAKALGLALVVAGTSAPITVPGGTETPPLPPATEGLSPEELVNAVMSRNSAQKLGGLFDTGSLAGYLDRQNQATLSDPNQAAVRLVVPTMNSVAAQANPNFAGTYQSLFLSPSQLNVGDYLPVGGGIGISAMLLNAGVGLPVAV